MAGSKKRSRWSIKIPSPYPSRLTTPASSPVLAATNPLRQPEGISDVSPTASSMVNAGPPPSPSATSHHRVPSLSLLPKLTLSRSHDSHHRGDSVGANGAKEDNNVKDKDRDGWMASLGMSGLSKSLSREKPEKEKHEKHQDRMGGIALLANGIPGGCPSDEEKPRNGILIRGSDSGDASPPHPIITRSPPSTAVSSSSSTTSSENDDHLSNLPHTAASPPCPSGRKIRFAPLPDTNRPRADSTGRNLWPESEEEMQAGGDPARYHLVIRGENGQVLGEVAAGERGAPETQAPSSSCPASAAVDPSGDAGPSPTRGGTWEGMESSLGHKISNESLGAGSDVSAGAWSESAAHPASSSHSGSGGRSLARKFLRPLGLSKKARYGGVPLFKSPSWGPEPSASFAGIGFPRASSAGGLSMPRPSSSSGEPAPRRRAQYPPVAQRKARMGGSRGGTATQVKLEEPEFVEWGATTAPTGTGRASRGAGAPESGDGKGAHEEDAEGDDGSGMAWLKKRKREREEKARLEAEAAAKAAVEATGDGETGAGAGGEPDDGDELPSPRIAATPASPDKVRPVGEWPLRSHTGALVHAEGSGCKAEEGEASPSETTASSSGIGALAGSSRASTETDNTEDTQSGSESESEGEEDDGGSGDGDEELDAEELELEERLQAEAKTSQGAAAAGKEVYRDHEHRRVLMQADGLDHDGQGEERPGRVRSPKLS